MNKTTEELLEERGKRYGSFSSFAEISQEIKSKVYTDLKLDKEKREANMIIMEGLDMVVHKLARILNGDPYYLDSWRDLSAYAKLVCDELEKTENVTDVKTIQIIRKNGEWVEGSSDENLRNS